MGAETFQELLRPAGITLNGKKAGDPQIHNKKFYNRVLAGGSLALGESYMDGWWDCDRLDVFFAKLLRANLNKTIITPRLIWHVFKAYVLNMQQKPFARRNVAHHYDIGNDLYEAMLDQSMAYSCGYWRDAKTLKQAQFNKHDLICKKLGLKKGMRVLDIGCGWGGFAMHAAKKYGVTVVGVTLSENQARLARKRCKGLPVTIKLQDYRDVTGSYDRIVSIGMFEHVGAKNYKQFFQVCKRLLRDDGLMLLHTIGRKKSNKTTDPWIATYIFPHGMLPSHKQIAAAVEGVFTIEDVHNFGADYDKTLMAWYENFSKHKKTLSYDERFQRMWEYYLLACAGSFRARKNQLWQYVLSPKGIMGGYDSIR